MSHSFQPHLVIYHFYHPLKIIIIYYFFIIYHFSFFIYDLDATSFWSFLLALFDQLGLVEGTFFWFWLSGLFWLCLLNIFFCWCYLIFWVRFLISSTLQMTFFDQLHLLATLSCKRLLISLVCFLVSFALQIALLLVFFSQLCFLDSFLIYFLLLTLLTEGFFLLVLSSFFLFWRTLLYKQNNVINYVFINYNLVNKTT